MMHSDRYKQLSNNRLLGVFWGGYAIISHRFCANLAGDPGGKWLRPALLTFIVNLTVAVNVRLTYHLINLSIRQTLTEIVHHLSASQITRTDTSYRYVTCIRRNTGNAIPV